MNSIKFNTFNWKGVVIPSPKNFFLEKKVKFMDKTQVEFDTILRFVKHYYNGDIASNKKKFLEKLDLNSKISTIPILAFLNETNVFSIYRYVIENDEMEIDELKKEVLKLYHQK